MCIEVHLQFIHGFPVLDPYLSLSLRVNKERVAGRLAHYQTILNAQLIVGKTLKIPL